MEAILNLYKILIGKPEGKGPLESGNIILVWILGKYGDMMMTGFIWPAQDGDQWRACEHGNESSGSIKGEEFLEWLSDIASQEGLCSMKLVGMHFSYSCVLS
jgi:hypothetical protein